MKGLQLEVWCSKDDVRSVATGKHIQYLSFKTHAMCVSKIKAYHNQVV